MASQVIPIIDFNAYSLEKEGVSHEELQVLSGDICNAFSTVGFCYLKNHGLSQEINYYSGAVSFQSLGKVCSGRSADNLVRGVKIDRIHGLFKTFFKLDRGTKSRYHYQPGSPLTGYRPLECDRYNQDRPAPDRVEAFAVGPSGTEWPEEVPQMKEEILRFRKLVTELALRVLDTISLTFSKEDKQLIRRCHKAMLTPENPDCSIYVRANFYPEAELSDVKEGQIRIGEHSDYGTLTLLFLDSVSGLEVKTRDGEYIPVHHTPGTAVLNLGDMMQRWTADKLIAAKHRVVFPDGEETAKERQSLVVFCAPGMDTEIRCLDGSDKYQPITARKYLADRMNELTKE